jgi:hypothetical protein
MTSDVKDKTTNTLVPDFEEGVPGPDGNKKNLTIIDNIGSSHR